MITPNLTDEQLRFLLYSICDESYEVMIRLSRHIDRLCQTEDILWCDELYLPMGINYPEELRYYGWKNPRQRQWR